MRRSRCQNTVRTQVCKRSFLKILSIQLYTREQHYHSIINSKGYLLKLFANLKSRQPTMKYPIFCISITNGYKAETFNILKKKLKQLKI